MIIVILVPVHPVHITQQLRTRCLLLHKNLPLGSRKLFQVLVRDDDVVDVLTLHTGPHSFARRFFEVQPAVLRSARQTLAPATVLVEHYLQVLRRFRIAPGKSLLRPGPTGIQLTFLFVFSLLVDDFYVFAVVDYLEVGEVFFDFFDDHEDLVAVQFTRYF